MSFKFTREERQWGFRFESLGWSYVIHLGLNLRVKSLRCCILGYGFHVGRIPYAVEQTTGEISSKERLEEAASAHVHFAVKMSDLK